MASPTSGDAQHSVPATTRAEILQELVEIGSTVANAQIEGFTRRLSDALLRVSQACVDANEARLHRDAANLLRQNRYPFFYVLSSRLTAALEREASALDNPGAKAATPAQSRVSLPPDVEIDKKLCLIKASRSIESEHADRLSALNVRLARLLGMEQLTNAHNPFRPHVFVSVIHDAWCEFNPDSGSHHLVFPLLQPKLSFDMAPILHALNAALIKRGIVPTLAEPQLAETTQTLHPATEQEAPAEEEDALTQQLRRLFPPEEPVAVPKAPSRPLDGAFPTLFEENAVHAAAARNELLDYLSSLQQADSDMRTALAGMESPKCTSLAEMQRRMPHGLLSPTDEHTFELVGKVFDALFENRNIPDRMKELIGSLQLPAVKAALINKDFFFKESFPARRSIELLARISVGWDPEKGVNDPHYLLVQRSVQRILQESDHRISVFADVAASLDAFIKRDETAAAQTLSATISSALQQEKLHEATRAAKHEVALRIGTGEVVAFVETFLEDKWVPVLTLAYTVKDEKPEAVESAIKTMDDLCWSVKPKITMAERKDLLARLPSMLTMLNKWLDLIKWNDEERTRFFAELARCHASIVRAPLELSPERQMQIALQVAKRAAERRLMRQARQKPEPVPDAFDEQVATLERGTWVEFKRLNGAAIKVKLAWTSPLRNLYIFSTRDRHEAMSMPAEELAQHLRSGRAQVLSVAGFVSRALATALGVNDTGNDSARPAA
ncbi:MAG TPA: DUF1631 family protein [Noviherbaspirillum sp.]|uniref:DUF1631 family protein n=1 Tax=Noviherbaspirillum sp. TaxID=1926288 RepID=UPI002B48B00E|nr:DUF1631 family protein [Noviherbaspirillum sp.]HJV87603.1 DUF1631 family protein [Noviherbaspirillum sp.]